MFIQYVRRHPVHALISASMGLFAGLCLPPAIAALACTAAVAIGVAGLARHAQ